MKLSRTFFCLVMFVVFASANCCYSQLINWEKTYGGSDNEYATSIKQVKNGYLIAGYTHSTDGDVQYPLGNTDVWVVMCDTAGNIIWTNTYGSFSQDIPNSINPTSDGGFILGGSITMNGLQGTVFQGVTDYFVVKADSQGNPEWQKCFGGPDIDILQDIRQTADGGYIMSGRVFSGGGQVSNYKGGVTDVWVVKLDDTGRIEWEKCLGGTDGERGNAVIQTPDKGYLIAGNTYSTDGDITNSLGDSDAWLVKLDSLGNIQWEKVYVDSMGDDLYTLVPTMDGGYIGAGVTYVSSTNQDLLIVKVDDTGGLMWFKRYGGTSDDHAFSIFSTADSGYIVCGRTSSNDGDVQSTNHGFFDVWIVKLENSGAIEWERCYGGSNNDVGYSIIQTTDNQYVFAGAAGSSNGDVSSNHGLYDFWVVKLHSDALGVEELERPEVAVFPTVSTGRVTIQVPDLQHYRYEVLNTLGQRIGNGELSQRNTTIDLPASAHGLIIIRVYNRISSETFKIIAQ